MAKIRLKKFLIYLSSQIVIFITSLLYHNKLTLLYYINISFYFSAAILLIGLFLFTVQTGFYDIAAKSISIAFSKEYKKKQMEDVTPLSKLITINYKPLFLYGLLIAGGMLVALIIYYV